MSKVRQRDPAGICTAVLEYLVDKGGYLPHSIIIAPRHWDNMRTALRPLGLTDQNTWLGVPVVRGAADTSIWRYHLSGSDYEERVPFLPDQNSAIERVLYDIMTDILSMGGQAASRYVIPPALFREITDQLGITGANTIKFFGHLLTDHDTTRHPSVCILNP